MHQNECLFNTEQYHRCNMREDQRYVRLEHGPDGKLAATLAGVLHERVLECGYSAPYGGIDFVAEFESPSVIERAVAAFIDQAREAGAGLIRIRCKPLHASSLEPLIQFALLQHGFQVERSGLSQAIRVGDLADMTRYVELLRSSPRRALHHGMKMDLAWSLAETAEEWATGYDVLQRNRAARGAALKYSLAYLENMRGIFPGKLRMGLLRHQQHTVAASLVYRVLPAVEYVAAWGDANHSLPHSPMNFLAYRLVQDAKERGIPLVDLGLSSNNGVADDGLVNFKRHVLAESSLRLDLVRQA